jgi:hypothetical protein
MKKLMMLVVLLVLAPALAATPQEPNPSEPCIPDTPVAVKGLLYARPFVLEEAYTSNWSADRPRVSEGMLLVLEVDPELIRARQVAEPVLYVGDRTAERVSWGNGSGRLVAIVPGTIELESAMIWFGTPALPERVTDAEVQWERQIAAGAGIRPLDADVVREALERGGDTLQVKTRVEMGHTLEDLVARFVTPFATR